MIEAWFPTPIYNTKLEGEDLELMQEEMLDVFAKEKDNFKKSPYWQRDQHSVTDYTFEKNILDDHACENAYRQISKHVVNYLSGLGLDPLLVPDFKITASWLTSTKEHEYTRRHSHGHVDIAGVYWVQTNGEDGELYFVSPNQLVRQGYMFQRIPFLQNVKPEVGTMMMWPGHLEHGVNFNTTPNERVSLSFNVLIKQVY
jgi:uncharacterized protein (TIGR02466 family)